MMETALTERLLSSTVLTDLVGDRIHWDERPQGDALPAITLQMVSRETMCADEGAVDLAMTRMQIDCWAKDAEGSSGNTLAKQVGQAVREALSDVSMVVGGIEFQGVFPDNAQDLVESGHAGATIYRRMMEFELWHKEQEI